MKTKIEAGLMKGFIRLDKNDIPSLLIDGMYRRWQDNRPADKMGAWHGDCYWMILD